MASLLPHKRQHLQDGWNLRDSRERITAYVRTAFYTRSGCVFSTDTRDIGKYMLRTCCHTPRSNCTSAVFAACDSSVGPGIRMRPHWNAHAIPHLPRLGAHAKFRGRTPVLLQDPLS